MSKRNRATKDWDGLFRCYQEVKGQYPSTSDFLKSHHAKERGFHPKNLRAFFNEYEKWKTQKSESAFVGNEKYGKVRQCVVDYLVEYRAQNQGKIPTYAEIRKVALECADKIGRGKFKASDGWIAETVKILSLFASEYV